MESAKRVSGDIGGRDLVFESGWIAKQANGSAVVTMGDTVVLAAVVCGDAKPQMGDESFLPLTVDYRERPSSAGKYPGGFIKREGRPTTKEILTCRLIDRPSRPLFPEGFVNEVMVMVNVLSADQENDPDIIAMNAASAALAVSDVPFNGPFGSVRVGSIDGKFIVNPTYPQLAESELDLVVSGTKESIVMVEGGAKQVAEEKITAALEFAHGHIKQIVAMQNRLVEECGKAKGEYTLSQLPEGILAKVKSGYESKLRKVFFTKGKKERSKAVKAVRTEAVEALCPKDAKGNLIEGAPQERDVKIAFSVMESAVVRSFALEGKRADSRGNKEIRPIQIQTGLLPRTHGSSLFTRGETQAIVTVTLGTKDDEQIIDGLQDEYSKKFMLHYNFPSFSVGEVKPIRGPGRREIGHGNLAEMAVQPILPSEEEFPYTIRIVSDILESNGSSSMATVCGSTLSLLDAGVKIAAPVAGIAMGLVKEGKQVAVLSDILGSEDKHGDMDFKVAGTEKGITAVQMDIKVAGIDIALMGDALRQAREGRLHILKTMADALSQPRSDLSPYAPRMIKLSVDPSKLGMIIGTGGKIVREIQEKTHCRIEIEDDGTVLISSADADGLQRAKEWVQSIVEELQVGKLYKAKVVTIKDFGAFVQIQPGGQEGLVHISELRDGFVDKVDSVVKLNQDVEIKVLSIDEQGRFRFSMKAAQRERTGGQSPAPQAAPAGAPDQQFHRYQNPK